MPGRLKHLGAQTGLKVQIEIKALFRVVTNGPALETTSAICFGPQESINSELVRYTLRTGCPFRTGTWNIICTRSQYRPASWPCAVRRAAGAQRLARIACRSIAAA